MWTESGPVESWISAGVSVGMRRWWDIVLHGGSMDGGVDMKGY